jgi:DNA ligase 1
MPRIIKSQALKFDLMLAKPYDPARIQQWKRIIAEPKLDGVRVVVICKLHKRHVAYYSRNGRRLYMFAHIDKEVMKFVERAAELFDERFKDGAMLDGEMTHLSGEFGSISGAIHTKDYTEFDARLSVFHAMPLERFKLGEDDVPQLKRMRMCRKIVKRAKLTNIHHHQGIDVVHPEEVQQAYEDHKRAGFEGTMIKMAGVPWAAKRSYAWMKLKPEETADVKIIDMKPGKGKYKGTLGALIFKYKGKKCNMSGMDDKQRRKWWRERNGKLSVIGRMMEVEYQGVTVHGSLRHPRFKRFRDDKQPVKKRTTTSRTASHGSAA